MSHRHLAFWSISATEILQHLETATEGLTGSEARQRLARYGSNILKPPKRSDVFTLLLAQFKSPLILILLFATGLSLQLLPAIISINLAHRAKRMAEGKVIVKRLASIENFGSMNVICSDKTGTLTEGSVHLQSALDVEGAPSDKVLLHAYLNAFYEPGFTNPIDEAIRTHRQFDLSEYRKADEIPYDFLRKRLSILVAHGDTHLMVTKGALANVLAVCSAAETEGERIVDIAAVRDRIEQHFGAFSSTGFRTLGVAYKNMGSESLINKDHEAGMTFLDPFLRRAIPRTHRSA
jgi:P-type Mg2+ transporter